MKDKMLKNINTALGWDEGVVNFDQMTGELYVVEDGELADMHSMAIKEHETTERSIQNFAYDLCKNSLLEAFHSQEIADAGMDYDHPEVFHKMLLDLKTEELDRRVTRLGIYKED